MRNEIRVIHLVTSYFPFVGGVESVVRNLVRSQKSHGINPLIIFPDRLNKFPSNYFVDEVEVVPFHFPRSVLPWFMFGIPANYKHSPKLMAEIFAQSRYLLQKFKPDILHIHNASEIAIPFLNIAKSLGIPAITHIHDEYLEGSSKPQLKMLVKESTKIIAVSDSVYSTIFRHVDSNANIRRIYSGVHVSKAFDISRNRKRRVVVGGRFVKTKGIDSAIDAFNKAHSVAPNMELMIVGNGPESQVLKEKVQALGGSSGIKFSPAVSNGDFLELIRDSVCTLVPSKNTEAFGLIALESLSVGTPVIASAIGGLPEIIDNGQTGFLVDPLDSDLIAEKIVLLASNEDLCNSMGEKGMSTAREKFGMERFTRDIQEEYLEILEWRTA